MSSERLQAIQKVPSAMTTLAIKHACANKRIHDRWWNMMNENLNQANGKSVAWTIPARIRRLKWKLLAPILVLLLHGHGFAYDVWQLPPGQPPQMWSKVRYDPKLTDPFFKSNEWSYAHCIIPLPDGRFEDQSTGRIVSNPPRLKHTAKCFTTDRAIGRVEDLLNFCKARLVDVNMIDLLIHEDNQLYDDALRVQIRNGMFASQFESLYKAPHGPLIWTTKRQRLTLDKTVYRKGDVIKGRIDFECVEEEIADLNGVKKWRTNPGTIKVKGIFKTVVK
jgi:hypothetical protein